MKLPLGILLLASACWADRVVPLPKTTNEFNPGEVNIKIVNGEDAAPGQFPHQGSLQLTSTGGHVCGCSLINSRWLVTAAHCINYSPSSYRVVLGLHDLSDYDNGGQPEIYHVSTLILHPDFVYDGSLGFPNDVALIQLGSDANIDNPFIQTIALAPDNNDDYLGAECYISGWGWLDGSGGAASILQYSNTSVICNDECASRTSPDWLTELQICVFTGYSSPCYGDSGGPLTCKRGGGLFLVGNSNWMIGACLYEYPSAYTRLSEYNDWIYQNMYCK